MKKIIFFTAAVLLSLTLPGEVSAAGEGAWVGNVNAFLGAKTLDEEDWRPVEEQGEFGAEVDFKKRAWPVGIAAGYLYGLKKGRVYDPFLGTVDIESETSELNVGLRKVWDGFPHFRPFIGGGLSLAKATARVTLFGLPVENSGSGTGYWLGGGAYWTLGGAFNIGFEYKTSSIKVKASGAETNAGGEHFGLLLGYHWGGGAKVKDAAKPPGTVSEDREESPSESFERDRLELEKQKLEIERQKLDLEKQKFEIEKSKLQAQ